MHALYQEWMDELNERMKKEGRHDLLLLDNASAHCAETLLSNVEIEMLPLNTTSVPHPMDVDEMHFLQDMHWCRDALEYGTYSTITNGWKHTAIIQEDL